MTKDELTRAYENFFLKSEAGKWFMKTMTDTINANYTKAENTPELARDMVQRAKGIREVEAHLFSVLGGSKPE